MPVDRARLLRFQSTVALHDVVRHLSGKHDQSSHGRRGPRAAAKSAAKKAARALTGSAALAAPPMDLAAMTAAGDPRADAIWYRTGDNSTETGTLAPGFVDMNQHMRHGGHDPVMDRRVADIDSVLKESRLPQPIKVYRGSATYHLGAPGTLEGVEFTDKAFVSASTDATHAKHFGSLMIIEVPAGISAVRAADRDPDRPESEIVLDRNLRYRVKAERFDLDERGRIRNHEMDIEVMP